ncbi:AfsA-related hotdog domain-containing protein [Streptomyces sp. NPDC047042]|uniref:AfsA-related hotdog domain-containing protein n=1 Tax=Streptomyces sp. NPDC047042 TaxID=3154807 RepID=UPI00340B8745
MVPTKRSDIPADIPAMSFTRHLVHRASSFEGIMHGSATPVAQHFTLSMALPQQRPDFGGAPRSGLFHDMHLPLEALRRSALFVAHRYFRVPAERAAVFSSTDSEVTALAPWRRSGGPAQLTMELTFSPVDVVHGVPRGLECESTLRIEGSVCGTATARMEFLAPDTDHHGSTVELLEGSREMAFLLAAQLGGFSVGSCILSRWNARLESSAAPGLPASCTASSGALRREPDGRPALPLTLVFSQGPHRIGTVGAVVLQDC